MAGEELEQEEFLEEEELQEELTPAPPNEWKGRLEQMQEALQQKGYRFDPSVNDFVPVSQQGYNPATAQQQVPTPAEEAEFDYEPASYRKMAQDEAKAIVAEVLGQLLPVIDTAVDTTVASVYNDWGDIKGDVLDQARQFGYTSLSALKTNPPAFELFVNAARGKRGATAPAAVPPVPAGPSADEILRQSAIASAASVGTSGGSAPSAPQRLDADERREAKEMNVTEEHYKNIKYGPATIGGNG